MAGRDEKFTKKQEINPADVSNISVTRGELDPTRSDNCPTGQLFPNDRTWTEEELYQMISNIQKMKPRLKNPKGQSTNSSMKTTAKEPARQSERQNINLPRERTAGCRVVNMPEVRKKDPEGVRT